MVTEISYTPEGLVDVITDPLGRLTDLDYDAIGRTLFVTQAVGTNRRIILGTTTAGDGLALILAIAAYLRLGLAGLDHIGTAAHFLQVPDPELL